MTLLPLQRRPLVLAFPFYRTWLLFLRLFPREFLMYKGERQVANSGYCYGICILWMRLAWCHQEIQAAVL